MICLIRVCQWGQKFIKSPIRGILGFKSFLKLSGFSSSILLNWLDVNRYTLVVLREDPRWWRWCPCCWEEWKGLFYLTFDSLGMPIKNWWMNSCSCTRFIWLFRSFFSLLYDCLLTILKEKRLGFQELLQFYDFFKVFIVFFFDGYVDFGLSAFSSFFAAVIVINDFDREGIGWGGWHLY